MDEDEFFDTQFPGAITRLQNLRAHDKEFDRICMDYQEMMIALAEPPHPGSTHRPRYLADLAETVSDLRSSIEAKLSDDPGAP